MVSGLQVCGKFELDAPHRDAAELRTLGLEDDEIPDAGLVQASSIIDDEDVPGLRRLERFEEDVDAAVVPRGTYSPRYPDRKP